MKKHESVVSHWSVLIDDFQASGQTFFEAIEENVRVRRLPGITFTRIEFKESGVLSDSREYLRIQHDDLIFDVGASPYGTGFFFSWWLVRSRARFPWLYPLGFFIVFELVSMMVFGVSSLRDGSITSLLLGSIIGFCLTLGLMIVMGRAEMLGPQEHIASAPLVGWLYRRFGNPVTYHSLDLVAMYQESIRRCVSEALDAALREQGRSALAPEERLLTLGDGSSPPAAVIAGR